MEVQIQLIGIAGVIITGIFGWLQFRNQRELTRLTLQHEEQKRESDRLQKEADEKIIRATTDAQQARGATDSLTLLIQTLAKTNETAAAERAQNVTVEKEHVEALKANATAIDRNTKVLETRNKLLDDVDGRLGDFVTATKKQTDTFSEQMQTTTKSLEEAVKKMDAIPGEVINQLRPLLSALPTDLEGKVNPLLDKLSSLEEFADNVKQMMREEIQKISNLVIEAVQSAQVKETAA